MEKVVILCSKQNINILLQNSLKALNHEIIVLAKLVSIKEAMFWLFHFPEPDLYFMDIQLKDGISLDLLSNEKITKPVVFLSPQEEAKEQIFKRLNLPLLTYPFNNQKISSILNSFNLSKSNENEFSMMDKILLLRQHFSIYRTNFFLKNREQLIVVPQNEIAYFERKEKVNRLITKTNQAYIINTSLTILEQELSPKIFFRINQQFIITKSCIRTVHLYLGNRFRIFLTADPQISTIVTKDAMAKFKRWLDSP